jgi:hypothetical protein
MNRTLAASAWVAGLLLSAPVRGEDAAPAADTFKACDNRAGQGFFWVDTRCGKTWWAEPFGAAWVYFGQPEGAVTGAKGTFIPRENKAGDGVFVLNTVSGEGWWTDGKKWKKMGKPESR